MNELGSIISETPYLVGIVGDRSSLGAFWEQFGSALGPGAFSRVTLVAAALPDGQDNADKPLLDLPVFPNFRDMLYMHPEINLVVETSGVPKQIKELRELLPPHVILVERAAASFFLHLLSTEEMWKACQVDLTATQSMLKTVIDQLQEDILFLDTDGLVLGANNSVIQRTGLERRELVGRRLDEIFEHMELRPPRGCGECENPFESTLRTGEPSEALGTSVDPFGRMHYYRLYTYPIHENGRLARVVAIRRDITSRTEIENRLQQSEKLASIGELSTYIAHEIRNPLFAISGFANSLLRTENLDHGAHEKLDIILAESRRLDEILKSILNFTRPMEQREGQCDLNEVARDTLEFMSIAARSQHVDTALDCSESLPRAQADPELIKQCLINLIKNALEAMPQGGAMRIATTMRGEFVALEVADTGPGIPVDIRDRVFSPFFSTKGKGAGLGLAMIRKIMDDLGGDVHLASREGEGTRVSLLLPPVLAVAQSESNE
ncbi:two-component system sensor histidine kinase NtrB [Paucidesulfovibrio longus]|uniref:two-component system sensor histidine kinase NtrB n=1 Tax=Paucidesulfovibrio longus TaxID=889 RepID=UPI0003B3D49E|nr:ATP-binding protein [Paucidesulfovibrio longus]